MNNAALQLYEQLVQKQIEIQQTMNIIVNRGRNWKATGEPPLLPHVWRKNWQSAVAICKVQEQDDGVEERLIEIANQKNGFAICEHSKSW